MTVRVVGAAVVVFGVDGAVLVFLGAVEAEREIEAVGDDVARRCPALPDAEADTDGEADAEVGVDVEAAMDAEGIAVTGAEGAPA
ncbi:MULTISPECIES: hypothetical protein [unclassified Streptomyces]|uniref:hypothetical protein n=1 Tax=unclassified Streptomyces TaxID=2593676 RepID=UPI00036FA500|nr:hypothetical protein [Streptomyces sp. BoleA5]